MAQRSRSLGCGRAWAAVLLLGGLAGCGGSDPGASPPGASGPPATVARDAAPAGPTEGAAPVADLAAVGDLRIDPAEVEILPGDPGFQLIVESRGHRGGGRDVGGEVAWSVDKPGVVSIEPMGYLRPIGTGEVTVRAMREGRVAKATVRVVAGPERPWDFGEDILPILTRAGCNVGGCHGRADGQNGFHLSLFGYDAAGDYRAITRGGGGRRLSPFDPERSLFLQKATGRIPHAGGQPLSPGSPDYRTVLAWLAAGAPESRGEPHGPLQDLVVEPATPRLDDPGPRQLRVLATYADGHRRDVSRLAIYKVNDDAALAITSAGRATLLKRAESDVVVRYRSKVVSVRLGTVINPDLAFDFAALPRRNVIDDELFRRLEALKVPPSPRSSDAVFLRRVSLDLTGLQPLPEEVRRFLADDDPEKRVKVVDRLLKSKEFRLFWKIKFGDLLAISQARFGNGAAYYHAWLEKQIADNAPWDQSVRTLLTALGVPTIIDGGPVNYALDGPDPQTQAEQTAQRFLGLRLRCAQCHDHPFDVWTQDDYFGMAAFFAKVQRGGGGMMGRQEVKLNPKGSVEHLRTKTPASPRFLDGRAPTIPDDADPRKALADWITDPKNPLFARATANWVWAQFFGKGLADPADDLSRANPPVHPELLDALARHFVEHRFDLQDLIRTIAVSEAYGLSAEPIDGNRDDQRLFSHHVPRPLTAHQMADAIAQATDVPDRFADRPAKTRAIEIYDPGTASVILDTFGRCGRTTGCASVATPPVSLAQSLLLMNGPVINAKLSSNNGYVADYLKLSPAPDEIVENLYVRTVCRPPTAEELSRWTAELKQAPSLQDAFEDLFWGLLNSREFAFNH